MWIHVTPGTKVCCANCAAVVDFGALEMFVDPDQLDRGRLRLTCACDAPFKTEDFVRSGAVLTRRVHIRRPTVHREVECGQKAQ